MANLALSQHIGAPVEQTFDVATDLPRAAEHIDAIDKIEVVSQGPVGVGTRWRETRTMFGRAATEEFEITAFDRPLSYTAGGVSCGTVFEFTFHFQPSGDGTDVRLELTSRPITFFAKIMSPLGGLMMGSMKKAMQQDLLDLKHAAEKLDPNEAYQPVSSS